MVCIQNQLVLQKQEQRMRRGGSNRNCGWSAYKTSWCCKNKNKGCDEAAQTETADGLHTKPVGAAKTRTKDATRRLKQKLRMVCIQNQLVLQKQEQRMRRGG